MFTVPYEVRLSSQAQMHDWLDSLGFYWTTPVDARPLMRAIQELSCIAVHQLVIRSGC